MRNRNITRVAGGLHVHMFGLVNLVTYFMNHPGSRAFYCLLYNWFAGFRHIDHETEHRYRECKSDGRVACGIIRCGGGEGGEERNTPSATNEEQDNMGM